MKHIDKVMEFIFNSNFAIGILLQLFLMTFFASFIPKIDLMNPLLRISIYAAVAIFYLLIYIWLFVRKHYFIGIFNLVIVGGLWIFLLHIL